MSSLKVFIRSYGMLFEPIDLNERVLAFEPFAFPAPEVRLFEAVLRCLITARISKRIILSS